MSKRFIEVTDNKGYLEGVIEIRPDDYCEIDREWLVSLLDESGRTAEEFTK